MCVCVRVQFVATHFCGVFFFTILRRSDREIVVLFMLFDEIRVGCVCVCLTVSVCGCVCGGGTISVCVRAGLDGWFVCAHAMETVTRDATRRDSKLIELLTAYTCTHRT